MVVFGNGTWLNCNFQSILTDCVALIRDNLE